MCIVALKKENLEIIILVLTFLVLVLTFLFSVLAFYYSRKNSLSQLLISLIEKESQYISEWNNQENDKSTNDDLQWKYINLLETISLFYNDKELNKNLTKRYFKNIFEAIYRRKRDDIEEKIKEGDFEELNILLLEWKIKKLN